MLRSAVQRLANRLGFDVVWRANSPRLTWLGLRGRDVRTILDVGANVGQFAVEAHRVFPRASFVCFEPVPGVAQTLRVNLARHGIVAQVVNVALSDAPGNTSFFLHVDHSPSSSLLPETEHGRKLYPQTTTQKTIDVRVETLDSASYRGVEARPPGEILLKLDVQGNELKVLRGAVKTLVHVDHVLCEVNFEPLYEGQPSFAEVHDPLAGAGFHYAGALQQAYGLNGRVVFMDALFTRADLRLARPSTILSSIAEVSRDT